MQEAQNAGEPSVGELGYAGPASTSADRYQHAAIGRRLLALVLDYGVILAWMAALGAISAAVYLIFGRVPDYLGTLGPVGSQMLFFFLLTFVVGVYLCRCEAGPHYATWGKRRMGLKVVAVSGSAPSRRQILLRTVVKLLPWEVAHTFMWQMMWIFHRFGYESTPPAWVFIGQQAATVAAIVYIVMVVRTGRGPHDRAARTVLVSSVRQETDLRAGGQGTTRGRLAGS